MFESCWLIEFEDGHKRILSEKQYTKEKAHNFAGRRRKWEQHWFRFEECKTANPGVRCFGFGQEPDQESDLSQTQRLIRNIIGIQNYYQSEEQALKTINAYMAENGDVPSFNRHVEDEFEFPCTGESP